MGDGCLDLIKLWLHDNDRTRRYGTVDAAKARDRMKNPVSI